MSILSRNAGNIPNGFSRFPENKELLGLFHIINWF